MDSSGNQQTDGKPTRSVKRNHLLTHIFRSALVLPSKLQSCAVNGAAIVSLVFVPHFAHQREDQKY